MATNSWSDVFFEEQSPEGVVPLEYLSLPPGDYKQGQTIVVRRADGSGWVMRNVEIRTSTRSPFAAIHLEEVEIYSNDIKYFDIESTAERIA